MRDHPLMGIPVYAFDPRTATGHRRLDHLDGGPAPLRKLSRRP